MTFTNTQRRFDDVETVRLGLGGITPLAKTFRMICNNGSIMKSYFDDSLYAGKEVSDGTMGPEYVRRSEYKNVNRVQAQRLVLIRQSLRVNYILRRIFKLSSQLKGTTLLYLSTTPILVQRQCPVQLY
jgi:hypothetical protein